MSAPATDIRDMAKKGNIKQMKASSNALQKENIAVEKKLSALKKKMKREKEERERMGGPRWKSSQKLVNTMDKQQVTKKNIKILSDQPLDYYKDERKVPSSESSKMCGQCEQRMAKVECNDCSELYCADCYKHFHSRGALRKHTWKSLDQSKLKERLKQQANIINSKATASNRDANLMKSPVKSDTTVTISDAPSTKQMISVNGYSVSGTLAPTQLSASAIPSHDEKKKEHFSSDSKGTCSTEATSAIPCSVTANVQGTTSLFEGEYNEEESAASFSEALNNWRKSRETSATSTRSTSVDTERTLSQKKTDVKVEFSGSPSMSYLDRIIVKKYKKNPNVLITAKYASKKQESSNTKPASGGSPVASVQNERTQSPCVLSVHCTSPAKVITRSSTVIEIHPCSSDDGEVADNITCPIVSCEGSDIDVKLDCSPRSSSSENTIELANISPTNTSLVLNSKVKKQIRSSTTDVYEYHVSLPQISSNTSRDNSTNKSCTSPTSENRVADQHIVWKQRPHYVNMDKFFLLGNDCISEINADKVITETSSAEENPSLNYDDVWRPGSSTLATTTSGKNMSHTQFPVPHFTHQSVLLDSLDVLESNLIEDTDKILNVPETTITAPTPQYSSIMRIKDATINDYHLSGSSDEERFSSPVRDVRIRDVTTYDYIQALPPLSKGDHLDKLHRSSTSLSISAPPVDVWADSDTSPAQSRKSSHLCANVSESRKASDSSEHKLLNERNIEETDAIFTTNRSFNKFNLLADEIIARRTVEDANFIDYRGENRSPAGGRTIMQCDTDICDIDNISIEDDDAGSGLTSSSDESDY